MRLCILVTAAAAVLAGYCAVYLSEPLWPHSGPRVVTCAFGPSDSPTLLSFTVHRRKSDGVLVVDAPRGLDAVAGIGYAHALDRAAQMHVARVAATGRVSEMLVATPETLAFDVAMRKYRLALVANETVAALDKGVLDQLRAYTTGVNKAFADNVRPVELAALRASLPPWTLEDTIAVTRMADIDGLLQLNYDAKVALGTILREAESAEAGRRTLGWLLRGVVPEDLFDEELARAVRAVGIYSFSGAPDTPAATTASNNWAELIIETPENYLAGFGIPGIPCVLFGRTKHIAFGMTYGFADTTDVFVENCEGSACVYDGHLDPVTWHTEAVLRRGMEPVTIRMAFTRNGLLDLGDPVVADGSQGRMKETRGMDTVPKVLSAKTVQEASDLLGRIEIGLNWVTADTEGSIAGMPIRKGWDSTFSWSGQFVPTADLAHLVNPPEGVIVTANGRNTFL
eukprot:m51a1_g4619 hypothetical protein (455) ;mRNA; f:288218-290072